MDNNIDWIKVDRLLERKFKLSNRQLIKLAVIIDKVLISLSIDIDELKPLLVFARALVKCNYSSKVIISELKSAYIDRLIIYKQYH